MLGAAPSEGEVTQSEIERRRLLVYQHGQDLRNDGLIDPPLMTRPQKPMTTLPQRRGGWLVMEDNYAGLFDKPSAVVTQEMIDGIKN